MRQLGFGQSDRLEEPDYLMCCWKRVGKVGVWVGRRQANSNPSDGLPSAVPFQPESTELV